MRVGVIAAILLISTGRFALDVWILRATVDLLHEPVGFYEATILLMSLQHWMFWVKRETSPKTKEGSDERLWEAFGLSVGLLSASGATAGVMALLLWLQ